MLAVAVKQVLGVTITEEESKRTLVVGRWFQSGKFLLKLR